MKKIKSIILFLISMSLVLSGCSEQEFEKDSSYETDVIGSFVRALPTIKVKKSYFFNNNGSFVYEGHDHEGEAIQSGLFSRENVNTQLEKITFVIEKTILNPNENSSNAKSAMLTKNDIYFKYKYKNMLGEYYKIENISFAKTFDLIISRPLKNNPDAAMVFTKDGFFHSCDDTENCMEDFVEMCEYQLKDGIIYFRMVNPIDDDWHIGFYVVKGGLFEPWTYKAE